MYLINSFSDLSIIFVVSICFSIIGANDNCPDKDLIKPCECDRTILENKLGIFCHEKTGIDLEYIFEKLSKNLTKSEKHFPLFSLWDKKISEIFDNTLKDITFETIDISYCENLTKIDKNAFSGTATTIRSIDFGNNYKFITDNHKLFDFLNQFEQVENITIRDNYGLSEIPTKAFNGSLSKLQFLSIIDNNTKISNHAFYNLNNLKEIELSGIYLREVEDNAFALSHPSNEQLQIRFVFVDGDFARIKFSPKSLINIGRQTNLRFGAGVYGGEQGWVTYLDEKAFLPFLLENAKNTIQLLGYSLDCDDCRNYWLKKHPNLVKKVSSKNPLICSNKKEILNNDNFKNCTSL